MERNKRTLEGSTLLWEYVKELIEKNVKNQKVDSIFSDLKTESKSAFIESLKAFQAQNPNFLSNIVNKELSRKYWAYGIIA